MKKIFTLIAATMMAVGAFAQTWKVSNEQVAASPISSGTVLADNEFVGAKTNFDAKADVIKIDDVATPAVYGDYSFPNYTQIRTANNVTAANPRGDQQSECMALIVTAKKNTKFTIYYRRQPVNDTYVAADGKDLKCWCVTDAKSNPGEITLSHKTADEAYGYCYQVFNLLAGKEYTFWAKGTTIQFYGFNTESLGDVVLDESWESKKGETSPVNLTSIKATFLDNTSKGSTAGAGTWSFDDSKALADQNGCEIKFEPTKTGYLTITLGAKLANNKSINMFVGGNTEVTIPATVVGTEQVIESGKTPGVELALGTGLRYGVVAGEVYNFYCGGTKYTISGFSFKPDEAAGIKNVTSTASAAKVVKCIENGQLVIKAAKGTFNVAGARIK